MADTGSNAAILDALPDAPRERDKHQRVFEAYAALGPGRTIAQLVEQGWGRPRTLYRWSAAFGWVERAAAHDLELIRTFEARRHALGDATLEEMRRRLADPDERKDITNADLVRWHLAVVPPPKPTPFEAEGDAHPMTVEEAMTLVRQDMASR